MQPLGDGCVSHITYCNASARTLSEIPNGVPRFLKLLCRSLSAIRGRPFSSEDDFGLAIIDGIHDGALAKAETERDPIFRFDVTTTSRGQ